MPSHKTTLSVNEEYHKHYLELQQAYHHLDPIDQRRFIRRNGFDLSGYKEFFESSFMVMVTYGRMTEDIRVVNGQFTIDSTNLTKRNVNKVAVLIPKVWKTLVEWIKDEFDMYGKV